MEFKIHLNYKKLSKTRNTNKGTDKDILDTINCLFKKDSDKLHFKYQDINSTEYLEQIIKEGIEFCKSNLSSHIKQYYIFCMQLLPSIIKLNINLMSQNQKHEYLNLRRNP